MVADSHASADVEVPIAVVLDANAMWHQWWLRGKSWEDLRGLVEQGRITLYVPEVVVQEVVRGRRHDGNDLVTDLDKVKLPRIEQLLNLGLPLNRKDLTLRVQELVADYDTELRARLDALHAVIIPIPMVSHQDILTRAMERRRPFDKEGRNGYRDVLIWHSLLDVAQHGYAGIVFVTNNTTDFCIGKPPSLVTELLAELGDVAAKTVAVVATSVDGVGAHIEELERRFEDELPTFERPSDDDIRTALMTCVDVIVAGVEPPTSGRWGNELEEGWPGRSILDPEPIDVVSIDLLESTLVCDTNSEDWSEFTAKVEAQVTLDGFAFKADFYSEDDDSLNIDVQDSDWNNHYMHVWEYHDALLTFRLTLDENGLEISECWLEEAEEPGSSAE